MVGEYRLTSGLSQSRAYPGYAPHAQWELALARDRVYQPPTGLHRLAGRGLKPDPTETIANTHVIPAEVITAADSPGAFLYQNPMKQRFQTGFSFKVLLSTLLSAHTAPV